MGANKRQRELVQASYREDRAMMGKPDSVAARIDEGGKIVATFPIMASSIRRSAGACG